VIRQSEIRRMLFSQNVAGQRRPRGSADGPDNVGAGRCSGTQQAFMKLRDDSRMSHDPLVHDYSGTSKPVPIECPPVGILPMTRDRRPRRGWIRHQCPPVGPPGHPIAFSSWLFPTLGRHGNHASCDRHRVTHAVSVRTCPSLSSARD
jgi:hypothetical protein